jgi:hypothetical protein
MADQRLLSEQFRGCLATDDEPNVADGGTKVPECFFV